MLVLFWIFKSKFFLGFSLLVTAYTFPPSKGGSPLSRKFYVRTGVNLTGLTCPLNSRPYARKIYVTVEIHPKLYLLCFTLEWKRGFLCITSQKIRLESIQNRKNT